MSRITENEARALLASTGSQAASPERYSAIRCAGGWAFAWADTSRPIPMGVRGIVVTDEGRIGRARIGETAEQSLRRLKG